MPLEKLGAPRAQASGPQPQGRGLRRLGSAGQPTAPVREPDAVLPPEEDGSGLLPVAAGAAGLGGLALAAAKMPGSIGKVAQGLNALRMQLMLSGLAVPKSILGNIGATAIESMERKSLKPLKALLSSQTVKDAVTAYKGYGQAGPAAAGANIPGVPVPGRVMGAIDVASRNAMQRGGLSADEAERAILQAPLGKELASALDSPAARYLLPFRRTPFNQFTEGLKTMKPENLKAHPGVNALVYGAGAAHGAATADEEYPLSIGLGSAAASRYGLPYALAAVAGRELAGGANSSAIAGSALPVSEYGLSSGITSPLRPFYRPAIRSLLEDR
jgi:hypothetical protein